MAVPPPWQLCSHPPPLPALYQPRIGGTNPPPSSSRDIGLNTTGPTVSRRHVKCCSVPGFRQRPFQFKLPNPFYYNPATFTIDGAEPHQVGNPAFVAF